MEKKKWAVGVAVLACAGAAASLGLAGLANAAVTPTVSRKAAVTAAPSPATASVLSGKRQVTIVRAQAPESGLSLQGGLVEVDDDSGRQRFVPTPLGKGRYLIKAYDTFTADPASLEPSCWQVHNPRSTQPLSVKAAPCDAENAHQWFTITAKGKQAWAIGTPDGAFLQHSRTRGLILQELGDAPLKSTFRLVDDGPAPQAGATQTPPAVAPTIIVPVYFHFITDGENGHYPQSEAQELVDYANRAFSGEANPKSAKTPFRFTLVQVRYVENTRWYDPELSYEEQATIRESLHVGDFSTLNVIAPAHVSGGEVSFAREPDAAHWEPLQDGVVLAQPHMTENPISFRGPLFVHEVGHWLGLGHTFSGECGDVEGSGDLVDDTPAHREHFGDEEEPDTCPDLPGKDPVHNFMAYYNRTPQEFTPGQAARMNAQWAQYRAS